MNIRKFEKKDFPVIEGWWKVHSGSGPSYDLLSDEGYLIDDVCAAWLYISNSSIAFLGWPVGNPGRPGKEVYSGLKELFNYLRVIAEDHGAKVVFSYTNVVGLLKLQEEMGFVVGDEAVTNMIIGV